MRGFQIFRGIGKVFTKKLQEELDGSEFGKMIGLIVGGGCSKGFGIDGDSGKKNEIGDVE